MSKRAFLLFSGSNDRAIFALARAFTQCKAPFSIVAWKQSDPILRSRYRTNVCAVRDNNSLTTEELQSWVAAAQRAHANARIVLVPSSEYLNTFLLNLGTETLESFTCELPLVDPATYSKLTNKGSSTNWFASHGIHVPRTLESWDGPLPIVAKPKLNVGDDNIVRYPILLHTSVERDAFLAHSDLEEYFPQEFVRGTSKYLLSYFSRDGRTYTASQTNLAQQAQGKSIVFARTANFHSEPLALATIHALQARGFHGFAMIEFIVGPDGPCFIEMNPRPWGPMQLCVDHDCGIVEAFVGDWLHGDPLRYEHIRREKPASTQYLWLGGILKDQRAGLRLRWQDGAVNGWLHVLRNFSHDVYLRRDSWKVFLDEVFRR